ncbi:MAG: hypothetical protein IJO01_02340 [Oscillospiraceae bacterium]|nr:hypothetical protein [Oscillospiraceae bacterium]
MNQLYSYAENIEREFGRGVKPRNLSFAEKEVAEKKDKMDKWHERLARDTVKYKADPKNERLQAEMNEANDGFIKAKTEYEDAEKALYSGDVFGASTADKTIGLIPCEGEINLADLYNVRFETDNKTARVVIENYNDTAFVSVVAEGEAISEKDIKNHVSVIKTDRENIKKIAGILNVPEVMLENEKDLLNGAIDSVQAKHSGNTETMLLCKAIQASKEAITVSVDSFSATVNGSLCAKAKRGAEIITNESGFAKLDVLDSNGNPMIKKNFDLGEFVFMDKYIVRILSDDTLTNNEDGSAPVFVGDWKNVLRLAVVNKYPPLIKHDLYNCVIENRAIKTIIPILTTTSDEAFIVGSI